MDKTVKEGKNLAIVSYLTFLGTLIAWSLNMDKRNKFASFHIRQAIGLDLLFVIFGTLISGVNSEQEIPLWYLTFPFWLICMVLWAFGFIGALQGKLSIIPFLGKQFQKWFKKFA